MTITLENFNDVILFRLENVLSYTRRIEQIFVAQCVWWLLSVITLEQRLINYFNNQQSRFEKSIQHEKSIHYESSVPSSPESSDPEPDRQYMVLQECNMYLQDSRRLRYIAKLKATSTTTTGRCNHSNTAKKKVNAVKIWKDFSFTWGIEPSEIERMKVSGECLRCAWHQDLKGSQRVKNSLRPIKLNNCVAIVWERNKSNTRYPLRSSVGME